MRRRAVGPQSADEADDGRAERLTRKTRFIPLERKGLMVMVTCWRCGSSAPEHARYCPVCGAALTEQEKPAEGAVLPSYHEPPVSPEDARAAAESMKASGGSADKCVCPDTSAHPNVATNPGASQGLGLGARADEFIRAVPAISSKDRATQMAIILGIIFFILLLLMSGAGAFHIS